MPQFSLRTLQDWFLGTAKRDDARSEIPSERVEAILSEFDRRKLPPVFRQIWTKTLPPSVSYLWRRPYIYFTLCNDLEQWVPRLKGHLPLWEINGDAIYGVLPDHTYFRFYYEDAGAEANPNSAVEVLGVNYQQFITSELVRLYDADDTDQYEQVARLFEYRYTTELKAILDICTDDTADQLIQDFKGTCA